MSALFDHMQRYVRAVFAQRLREEGFSSYKGEDIHWYRLVNDEVVQAVYFVTRSTTLPSSAGICYGCHPLYIPPIFQKSPYRYAMPAYEQMMDRIPERIAGSTPTGWACTKLFGMYNRPYRVPDAMIMCPRDKHDGLDILEQILSVMERVKTPLACYELHKAYRAREIENENDYQMSSYFVDEVLFWEDTELYPFCEKFVAGITPCLEKLLEKGELTRREDREHFKRLQQLQTVFENGDRQAYMQELQIREQKTRNLINRYCGYPF